MKTARALLLAAVAFTAATTYVHFRLTGATARGSLEISRLEAETVDRVRQVESLERDVITARNHEAATRALVPNPPAAKKPAAPAALSGEAKLLMVARDAELRRMHVQAYVNQRRVAFAGFLKEVRATPETLGRFDAIHAEYQQGLLDSAVTAAEQGWRGNDPQLAALRSQLAGTRNAQCDALFADEREAWHDANRTLGAREVVNQIIQQNLQGAAGYTESLADQLTQMLADSKSGSTAADATGYDWEAVVKNAATVLSPTQLEGFRTSVAYYQAQARMGAMGGR